MTQRGCLGETSLPALRYRRGDVGRFRRPHELRGQGALNETVIATGVLMQDLTPGFALSQRVANTLKTPLT